MNFPVFANEEIRYIDLHVLVFQNLLAHFYPGLAILSGHYDAQGKRSIGQGGEEVVLLLLGYAAHLVVMEFH